MRRIAGPARAVVAALAAFAAVFTAEGWLYLVHAGQLHFGPRIADTLPLDELPAHAAVPLALFLAVWIAAAVGLGLVARAAGADRVSAAVLLALWVGTWSYLQTAVSILVVRQISAEAAFRAAGSVHAVYIPAMLAGLAGALLGRARKLTRSRAAVVLASLVAVAGL